MHKNERISSGYPPQQIYTSGGYATKSHHQPQQQQQRHQSPYEGPSETYSARQPPHSSGSLASSPYSSSGVGSGKSGPPQRTYYYSSTSTLPQTNTLLKPSHTTASDSGAPSSPAEISPSSVAPPRQYRTTTTTITTDDNRRTDMDPYQPHPNTLHHSNTLQSTGRHGGGYSRGSGSFVEPAPSYQVEHLASFAVGPEHGIVTPADGVNKLKLMEKKSAIWAQPMILKMYPDRLTVEEENGVLVEQFLMELIYDPTAHQSTDPADMFNNVLLFVVKEDPRNGRRNYVPTEMHIFQVWST